MHELSICTSIAEIVQRHAAGRRVTSVQVRLGQLRQIVPDSLTFCWAAVSQDPQLRGASLDIEYVPAKVDCGDCGQRGVLDEPYPRCPACGSAIVTILEGEEFQVTSIDVSDEPFPDGCARSTPRAKE